jgi:hypothetical protein
MLKNRMHNGLIFEIFTGSRLDKMVDHIQNVEYAEMIPVDVNRRISKRVKKQRCKIASKICIGLLIIVVTLLLYFLMSEPSSSGTSYVNQTRYILNSYINHTRDWMYSQRDNSSEDFPIDERKNILNSLDWHFFNESSEGDGDVETNEAEHRPVYRVIYTKYHYDNDEETKIEWFKILECRTHAKNKTIFDSVLEFGKHQDLLKIFNDCQCKHNVVC